jgi:hypothetical protein
MVEINYECHAVAGAEREWMVAAALGSSLPGRA